MIFSNFEVGGTSIVQTSAVTLSKEPRFAVHVVGMKY